MAENEYSMKALLAKAQEAFDRQQKLDAAEMQARFEEAAEVIRNLDWKGVTLQSPPERDDG